MAVYRREVGTHIKNCMEAVPSRQRLAFVFREVESMEMNRLHDQVMKRAYELFDGNGHLFGKDVDDWLQAERELVWKPAIELEEKDNEIRLQIAAAGVDPKDLNIEVTPEDVLVKAETRQERKEEKDQVHVCEFTSGNLFHSIHLPKKIDPDKVKAYFKNGNSRMAC